MYSINLMVFSALIIGMLYPSSKINDLDFRNLNQPISVSIPKNNPALAALMDSQLDIPEREEFFIPSEIEVVELKSGPFKKESKNLTEIIYAQEPSSSYNEIDLEVLPVPSMYATSGDLLPLSQRKEIIEKYLTERSINLSGESWKERAENLISQSPNEDITEVSSKEIFAAGSGSPIIIKKIAADNSNQKPGKLSQFKKSAKKKSSKNSGNIEGVTLLNLPEEEERYELSGDVELRGGLALTDADTSLHIYQEKNGEIVNEAQIWLEQGKYEIIVEGLSGYLVAEIYNSAGELLAQSETDLSSWSRVPYHANKIEGVHLLLEPLNEGINFEVLSVRSFGNNKIEVPEAKAQLEGIGRKIIQTSPLGYADKFIGSGSQSWVEIKSKKYSKTVSPISSEKKTQILMYPKAYLEAVAQSLEIKNMENKGWLSGKISGVKGAISGAKIEIVGLEGENEPIYFKKETETLSWPDKTQKLTSENGMFILPNMNPGIYSVRVIVNDIILPAEIFNIQKGKMTYLDLSYFAPKSAGINIFDPVYGVEFLSGKVGLFGSDTDFFFFGTNKESISFPSGNGSMIFDVDAGAEYLLTRSKINRDVRNIRIPAVPKKWFSEITEKTEMKLDESLGVIIGYIDGDDYDVLIEDENEIVYFDKTGNVIKDGFGIMGGGFIISNVQEGISNVAIVPHNKKNIVIKSVPVESGYTNTFEINLFK